MSEFLLPNYIDHDGIESSIQVNTDKLQIGRHTIILLHIPKRLFCFTLFRFIEINIMQRHDHPEEHKCHAMNLDSDFKDRIEIKRI